MIISLPVNRKIILWFTGLLIIALAVGVVIKKVTEKPDCEKIREYCICKCSETTLPTGDNGFKFWNCVNKCMEENGCK